MLLQMIGYIIGGIISMICAILLVHYNERHKKKIEKKELHNIFRSLYSAFQDNDLYNIIHLIKKIGIDKIEEVFNCIGHIWFKSEKKDVKGTMMGVTTNYEQQDKEQEIKTIKSMKYKLKINNQQYINEQDFQNLRIRIDTERWMITLGTTGLMFYIIDKKNNNNQYNGWKPDSNKNVLDDFLNYIKSQYNKHNIKGVEN